MTPIDCACSLSGSRNAAREAWQSAQAWPAGYDSSGSSNTSLPSCSLLAGSLAEQATRTSQAVGFIVTARR